MSPKIGIGIITYKAPEKIQQSAFSVPTSVDEFVIVNDGTPYPASAYPSNAYVIQHETNMGIARSKNDVLKYLIDKGCEHLFLMEDDVIIKDPDVFKKYIQTASKTGILHLNYALQGPYNFKQTEKQSHEGTLNDRYFDEKNAEPAPLYTHDYNNGIKISFYPACVGAFSYFRRSVITDAGYFDETFKNSWEHVEHTYRIIKKGYHPPFGWFADIADSNKYIANIDNCMENSTVAKDPQWKNNSVKGVEHFIKIHGHEPGEIPKTKKTDLLKSLNDIYHKNRDMVLLIKFPTRGRTEKFLEVLDQYISFIEDKDNYKIVVSCDADDTSMNNPTVISKLKNYKNLEIYFGANKSKIEAVNADMQHQQGYDIILLASDDMIPVKKGFDVIIKNNMKKYFPDLDGVLWFNDGYQEDRLNTLCILGRKYYERFKYIYHPAYKSLWCDNEFMNVGSKLKRQVYINEVIIKHDHPASNTNLVEDELYQKNLKLESVDRLTYEKRKKQKFDLKWNVVLMARVKHLFKKEKSAYR